MMAKITTGSSFAGALNYDGDLDLKNGKIVTYLYSEESVDWPAWRYSPFAGNFQLIFYKNKKGEVLVKPLLNERETAIVGLEGYPYYKWEEVRALWNSSL